MSRRLRVRFLSLVAGVVLFIAVVELASWALFYVAAGRRFSYAAIAREQAAEAAAWTPPPIAGSAPAASPAPPVAPGAAVPGRPEATPVEVVPHPFMGFVYNPEFPQLLDQQGRGAMPLTEHGFFSLPDPPGQGEEITMAVFGGSVAAYLAVDAREAMTRVLHADLRLRDKRVRVHSFALGGFKQPQMLGTLAYLMALGQRFDVVVELDGLNEAALTFMEYKEKEMFPAYPRFWETLVGEIPTPELQRKIGKVTLLQEWRARVARRFSRPPLSWSITGGLLWKVVDRLISGELVPAREDVAKAAAGNRYRDRGPQRRYASDGELVADIAHLWASSSVQMQRLCAGAGTRYHHFLQPNQYLPGSKPMGQAEKAVAYRSSNPYRSGVEAVYPALRAEGGRLSERGVDFHDLTGLYAGIAEPIYTDDCCHVNARGNALLAEAVARAILAGWPR